MTVQTTHIEVQYEGNDSTTAFPVTFEFDWNEQVHILHQTGETATGTLLIEDTDYTLTQNEDTGKGSVTYPVTGDPLPAGEYLLIYRDTEETQLTDLLNQGALYPETLELTHDKAMFLIQELIAGRNRSYRVSRETAAGMTDDELETETGADIGALVDDAEDAAGDAQDAADDAEDAAANISNASNITNCWNLSGSYIEPFYTMMITGPRTGAPYQMEGDIPGDGDFGEIVVAEESVGPGDIGEFYTSGILSAMVKSDETIQSMYCDMVAGETYLETKPYGRYRIAADEAVGSSPGRVIIDLSARTVALTCEIIEEDPTDGAPYYTVQEVDESGSYKSDEFKAKNIGTGTPQANSTENTVVFLDADGNPVFCYKKANLLCAVVSEDSDPVWNLRAIDKDGNFITGSTNFSATRLSNFVPWVTQKVIAFTNGNDEAYFIATNSSIPCQVRSESADPVWNVRRVNSDTALEGSEFTATNLGSGTPSADDNVMVTFDSDGDPVFFLNRTGGTWLYLSDTHNPGYFACLDDDGNTDHISLNKTYNSEPSDGHLLFQAVMKFPEPLAPVNSGYRRVYCYATSGLCLLANVSDNVSDVEYQASLIIKYAWVNSDFTADQDYLTWAHSNLELSISVIHACSVNLSLEAKFGDKITSDSSSQGIAKAFEIINNNSGASTRYGLYVESVYRRLAWTNIDSIVIYFGWPWFVFSYNHIINHDDEMPGHPY